MESMESMWEKFSLTEHEEDTYDLGASLDQSSHVLAAKFVTRRTVNAESVARTFKPLWKTAHGFTVKDMGENRMVFSFEDVVDLERVLLNEPWTYDKHLVILQRIVSDVAIESVVFSSVPFWIQIHGLPIRSQKAEVAEGIGRSLGEVDPFLESEGFAGGGSYVRIRVRLDCSKPLCRSRRVRLGEGRMGWLSFKFERLPIFCYHCGLLTHAIKDCEAWLRQGGGDIEGPHQYGDWLRANAEYVGKTRVVSVKGCRREPPSGGGFSRDMRVTVDPIVPDITPKSREQLRENDLEPLSNSNDKAGKSNHSSDVAVETGGPFSTVAQCVERVEQIQVWGSSPEVLAKPKHTKWKKLAREVVKELTDLVRIKDPSAVFIIETWLDEDRLEILRCKLSFANKLVVPRRNRGGGLVLFWKRDLAMTIKSFSTCHIDTIINEGTELAWRFTGFYGAPETQNRAHSWNVLRTLHQQFSLPWCCAGDFNELVSGEEKKGGRPRPDAQMQAFRSVLDDCGFQDLGFNGPEFTWCNNRQYGATIWARLDRFVVNTEWLLRFQDSRVHHIPGSLSDHMPLWLSPTVVGHSPRRQVFRFESMWLTDEGCQRTVEDAWRNNHDGSHMVQLWNQVKDCRRRLRFWSRNSFGSVRRALAEKRKQLEKAELISMHGGDHSRVMTLRSELGILLEREEKMWSQRSRASWLQEGDRNTRFFHSRASQRRRRNTIVGLSDDNGSWCDQPNQVVGIALDYFQNLFHTMGPTDVDRVLDHIPHVITEDMHSILSKEYSASEVERAIMQMGPRTAPGPDGMPPLFYQSFWPLIGNDVTAAVLSSLNSGSILQAINHTYSYSESKGPTNHRVPPHYCCSACLFPGLNSTGKTQSAFVPGRLITDNILVAFETLHHMKHHMSGKTGSMALKLDMSKAYDRVEWVIPSWRYDQNGISSETQIIALIMECLRTAYVECQKVLDILSLYERASGQSINKAKTTLFFSKSTPAADQADIIRFLGVPVLKSYEKYLGLPSFIGRSKMKSFAFIKDRVWLKLQGWKERLLSQAGREILIKAVVQAIPTYSMSCFRLPDRLCHELEGLMRRFWWGHGDNKRKICWIKWKSLCQPKSWGGMGFRGLKQFNTALLGKQVWRLMTEKDSLFYKVFQAKFFPRGSIMEAKENSRGSFAWKSILGARQLIRSGMWWRVGDGSQVKVWGDSWLPTLSAPKLISPCPSPLTDLTVEKLIDPNTHSWALGNYEPYLLPFEVAEISRIPLSLCGARDALVWPASSDGLFSVRSAYRLLLNQEVSLTPSSSSNDFMRRLWKSIWSLPVTPKVRNFLWRACGESLSTSLNLWKRKVIVAPICDQCQGSPEDALHALWSCPIVARVGQKENWLSPLFSRNFLDFTDVVSAILEMGPMCQAALFGFLAWSIWQVRNKRRLNQGGVDLEGVNQRAYCLASEFSAGLVNQLPRPAPPRCLRWSPPPPGYVKVNYDGAVFLETMEAGLGVVIRDELGRPMVSLSQKVPFPGSSTAVEALALRRAMFLAIEMGFYSVIVEGDSEMLVRAVTSLGGSATVYGHVVEDVQYLTQQMTHCEFTYVQTSTKPNSTSSCKES
uniref:CCHC-type domain-containing protein n=1 Tax=Fagus sylvatica TaxID=28930 RepID=A0A2N9HKV4_FAGSY